MASRNHGFFIIVIFVTRLLVSCSNTVNQGKSDYHPPSSWQTVFPDTNLVLPLFGKEGPQWTLESTDGAYQDISAKVPGDVLSDLMEANVIEDPYVGRNFLTQRHVWMGGQPNENSTLQRTRIWKYTTNILVEDLVSAMTTNSSLVLVVEGIKMGASISWNGLHVGLVQDQFLRYTFVLEQPMIEAAFGTLDNSRPRHLESKQLFHELSITFDPSIATDGRFMACSGGWDWAPYTRCNDERGSPIFSFGITKPLYLVAVKSIYMSNIVPKIYYKGSYPREPMRHGPQGDFEVSVNVHLETIIDISSNDVEGMSIALRSNFSTETIFANVTDGSRGETNFVTLNMVAPKETIQLWWPNGLGKQPLYHIEVSLHDSTHRLLTPWVRKQIGFRTAALVTVNDTDDSIVADILANNTEGSGSHGMYLRINGAVIWSRGANFVPMDELESRLSDQAHRIAVESAAAAHMNLLRVWGGGMILPESFYEACDEYGILLYHDLMFVEEQGHGALRSPTVESEIRHIVRSLAFHVSIVVWNGCNECTYFDKSMEIYSGYVMQTLAEEDDTRSIWPTSPSEHGWKTGVFMIDGRPNGNPLTMAPLNDGLDKKHLEDHGPYQHGWSKTYPSVNGQFDGRKYETHTPPEFTQSQVGVVFPNTFISEFGASVFSSFESMSETLEENDWDVHGGSAPDACRLVYGNRNECQGTNVLAERNYACDSHILAYFGDTPLDEVGAGAFQSQLYLCMISQALWIKGQLEVFRASNLFGALIWQMNEIWPTGGWGLVEYDGTGQGGRWKPLMHLLQNSVFRDVFVACGSRGLCYARNDGLESVTAVVTMEGCNRGAHRPDWMESHKFELSSGPGTIVWFQLPLHAWNATDVVFLTALDTDGKELMAETVTFWNVPGTMTRVASTEDTYISVTSKKDYALVNIESKHVSIYVTLSTRAKGRFTENAFHLKPRIPKTVRFESFIHGTAVDVELLKQTIRVDQLILSNHLL